MKQFWSATVYDNDTRCLINTGELPDKSSRMDLATNGDGSVDLYFGPEPPDDAGRRGDWHSFEPVTSMVERCVDAFASSMPLYIRQMAEIARKSA